jgi:Holliday junction resolvase RusA-like endonuclease
MKQYILPGSVRSKKNSKRPIYVGGKNQPKRLMLLPSSAFQKWERAAKASALSQGRYSPGLEGKPVQVQVTAYIRGTMPDLSGVLESVGDLLEGLAYNNDKQIVSWDGSRVYRDKDNPRTIVAVREAT